MSASTCATDCTFNKLLLKQLECPVCFDYCERPIYMCANGHNMCNTCQKKLEFCCMCNGAKPAYRNLMAEELSKNVIRPCKNAEAGCKQTCTLEELETHLQACDYGYYCLISECDWSGHVDQLRTHVETEHPDRYVWCFENVAFARYIFYKEQPNTGPVNFEFLICCDDQLYWIVMHFDKILRGFVRAVPGSKDLAGCSEYRAEFSVCTEDKKRELLCRCDIFNADDDITEETVIEMFHGDLLEDCLNDDDELKVQMKIFRRKQHFK